MTNKIINSIKEKREKTEPTDFIQEKNKNLNKKLKN